MPRRQQNPDDLSPYDHYLEDEQLGLVPLAIGWLDPRQPFATGRVSDPFITALQPFCTPENSVYSAPMARPCPLCRQRIDGVGQAEIRVIGESEIYAAPDFIHHFVTEHQYKPPQEFIEAVLECPADSPTHRALINALPR